VEYTHKGCEQKGKNSISKHPFSLKPALPHPNRIRGFPFRSIDGFGLSKDFALPGNIPKAERYSLTSKMHTKIKSCFCKGINTLKIQGIIL